MGKRASDPEGFWQVWIKNESVLLSNCLRLTGGDKSEADDLMSFSMLKGLSKYSIYGDEIENHAGWLSKLVYNTFIDLYRKESNEKRMMDRIEDSESPTNAYNQYLDDSLESRLINEEYIEQIQDIIQKLPENLQDTFNLYILEEMSYKDISNLLEISEENAGLHRKKYFIP